jgi:uncharacterized protein (DUF2252 family)
MGAAAGSARSRALLGEQAADRVPELVPIRYGRMSASPFAFYRGAAYVMASDLAGSPQTDLRVQPCGDAHLANFGAFASPERQLLFDLNDFDETLPGPCEWDGKRLAASVAVAGRENGFEAQRRAEMVRELVGEYRQAIRRFAAMPTLDVWYARVSVSDLQELVHTRLRSVDGELEVEATASVDQFELGMSHGMLGMIQTPSQLIVRGRLVRDGE